MTKSTKTLPSKETNIVSPFMDEDEKARIRSELGSRVKSLRVSEGMTLEQASEKTGLAVSTIYKVENGKVSPSFENLLRLARGYSVGLEKLIESPPEEVNTTRLTVTRSG
ncbi:Helix-turn-helix, partial [Ruegeria halocynthiae]